MGSNDSAQLTQAYDEILFKLVPRISFNARLSNCIVNPYISWEQRYNVLPYCDAPIFIATSWV